MSSQAKLMSILIFVIILIYLAKMLNTHEQASACVCVCMYENYLASVGNWLICFYS